MPVKTDRIWSKGFTILILSNTLYWTGIYMLVPSIPLYLVTLGAAETQVGVVATIYFVSSIITRLLVNVLLQRVGKKLLMVVGVLLNSMIMVSYSFAGSIGIIAVLRVVQGFGFGTTTTIIMAMAADTLPDSRRGQGIGYFGLGTVVAMSVAPALSINLVNSFGFRAMFFTSAGILLMTTIIISFVEEPPIVAVKEEKSKKTVQWRNLFDRKLIVPSVLLLLIGVSRSSDMQFIAIFARERKLEYLSLYFVIQTAAMFCIRFISGRFADRKGRNWVLIPGGVALFAMGVILSFADRSWIMLLGAVFSGLGVGVLSPGLQLWMFNSVAPEKRNVASATYFNFTDIGISAGALMMGFTAENFGYPIMFRIAALAALLHIIGCLTVGRDKKQITSL